jgi:hypothetical protein
LNERVLSSRELNRAMLARQLLLERSGLPLTRALERVAGLQTQYAPSPYIALWSRLREFRRGALDRALRRHRVFQGTLMRVTIHMASSADYPLFAAGIRRSRREWWLRIHSKEIEGLDMEAVANRLRRHLVDGARRAGELKELLRADGFPSVAWSGAGLWLDMVRLPPSGTWEHRRADLYGLAEAWLESSKLTEREGLEHLIRRYLGGFGPASMKNIAEWAGVPVTRLAHAAERLTLRRFRDERGDRLFDLPRMPLPDPHTPAPVRFLPTWDATLLIHARRTQILPEPYRPIVFANETPPSLPTFLVDGAVAGSWLHGGGRVRLEPFGPIPRASRRELENEAGRLSAFHSD